MANHFPIMIYEVILDYKITYFENEIISLYFDEYTFTGGAHGNTVRSSQNWDLILSKQFSLSSLFPSNPNYLLPILQEIHSQIKENMETDNPNYFDNYCELVLQYFNPENFYLSPGYVNIFFQLYEIAPYVTGIPVFSIKLS